MTVTPLASELKPTELLRPMFRQCYYVSLVGTIILNEHVISFFFFHADSINHLSPNDVSFPTTYKLTHIDCNFELCK